MDTRAHTISLDGDWRLYSFPEGDPQVAHPDELAASGLQPIPARVPVPADGQRLFLMEWEAGGRRFGNHYVAGAAPISLEEYRAYLPAIAALAEPFDADQTAR